MKEKERGMTGKEERRGEQKRGERNFYTRERQEA